MRKADLCLGAYPPRFGLARRTSSRATPLAEHRPECGLLKGTIAAQVLRRLHWKWDKTRRTDPARISRHWLVLSVATLLALAYGTRVEDAHDRRIAPGNLRTPPKTPAPGAATPGAGRYGPSASSATASTGCGGCCSGDASGAASGCCPNLGRNPNQIWRLLAMPLRENLIHTPVSPREPPKFFRKPPFRRGIYNAR